MSLESLPVELVADILGELDLESLIVMSYLSRRLHHIATDETLNPWRRPILHNLRSGTYERSLAQLSVRRTVPRHNFLEILSIARPAFLLFEATLPNLDESYWEECFRRRFLPGWSRWKKDCRWKEAFIKILHRVWHRSTTSCTSDEAWTKYIVLNRNGSVNELDSSSRTYNPLAILDEMKLQSNLDHLETRVRLVVEFADVRILALGVLNKPRGSFSANPNAHVFLHPPGVDSTDIEGAGDESSALSSNGSHSLDAPSPRTTAAIFGTPAPLYERLLRPLPAPSHSNYPFYTAGGSDKRWLGLGDLEEEGLQWVGGLMITAQLIGPHTHETTTEESVLQDMDLVVGPGRQQYSSFCWADLMAIAPWMEERITKRIVGPGLGH
ncbi:hypothetical protein PLICRDRAFT_33820 [Plicaturopsis crispa FD-325 SS-3]|nr:hypothetical protein PLICRDRAFT_33820 [Plicaturopsis crispa FD-325 SS-3]